MRQGDTESYVTCDAWSSPLSQSFGEAFMPDHLIPEVLEIHGRALHHPGVLPHGPTGQV